jgi:glycosyltransferase involved in cell wall biosynthesis
VIVGHPSDEEHFQEVQALARSLGVEKNIHFVGGHREISPFLQMSQVFCMLSRSEGFSNALIEAMAAGLPCVTTRVGGNSEAFEEGKSGFLVENEDAEAAAQRILLLLRNPALARRMGDLARQVVAERFQLDVMMQKLTSLYEGLLNRRKR